MFNDRFVIDRLEKSRNDVNVGIIKIYCEKYQNM